MAALGKEGDFGMDFHSPFKIGFRLSITTDPDVICSNSFDRAGRVVEDFGSSKGRVDFNTKLFSLFPKPSSKLIQRHNVIPSVGHLRGMGHGNRPFLGEKVHAVFCCGSVERRALVFPIGDQFIQSPRLQNGSRENM